MSNVLQDGIAWVRTQQKAWYSYSVTYYRGNTPFGPILAARGSTTSEIESGDLIIETKSVDWIFEADDLPDKPQPGDFIVVSDRGETRYFEVAAISGQAAWRWHDSDTLSIRVHSRLTNDLALTPPDATGLFAAHFGGLYGNHFGGNWTS